MKKYLPAFAVALIPFLKFEIDVVDVASKRNAPADAKATATEVCAFACPLAVFLAELWTLKAFTGSAKYDTVLLSASVPPPAPPTVASVAAVIDRLLKMTAAEAGREAPARMIAAVVAIAFFIKLPLFY